MLNIVVNDVILDSIPIQKRLKRYFVMKYRWLAVHNGLPFAADVFKDIKTIVMSYISDLKRHEHVTEYVERLPIGNKKAARALLLAADTQPHAVINLVKLYTGQMEPVVDKASFGKQHVSTVNNIKRHDYQTEEKFLRPALRRGLRALITHGLIPESHLGRDWWPDKPEDMLAIDWVGPESYRQNASESKHHLNRKMVEDIGNLMRYAQDPLNPKGDVWDMVFGPYKGQTPVVAGKPKAGRVEYIPKNGTTTWRAIGNASRFFNELERPFQVYLFALLRMLPNDHTHDQSSADKVIQERLDNGQYVGSVDLSSATEYMPVEPFLELLAPCIKNPVILESLKHTSRINAMAWDSDYGEVKWRRGQALGTLASFGMLSFTHHLILAALADLLKISFDPKYQPWHILGDDLIVFDKDLREAYIKFMKKLGSPLSLHKSFDGRMVEFAGKVFVKNQQPRYTSDHNIITKNTLLDYVTSTKTHISFHNLPKNLRRWWIRGFESDDIARSFWNALSKYQSNGSLDQRELNRIPIIVQAG